MKKIANKTICLLLTLVMLLGVMPLAGMGTFRAKAAEAAEAAQAHAGARARRCSSCRGETRAGAWRRCVQSLPPCAARGESSAVRA